MKRRCLPGTLLAVFAAGSLYAALSAPSSLPDMAQSADLIVVGVAGHGSQTANGISFTIQVDRVVKGSPALAGGAIAVSWANGGPSTFVDGPRSATGNGLWFLQSSSGEWTLMPVMQGTQSFAFTFIPEQPGPILSAYAYDLGASLSDKVASELSAAIESAGSGPGLLGHLHHGALDQLNSPVIQVLYRRLAGSTATYQQALGLAGQIRGGNATALGTAAQAASSLAAFAFENGVLLDSVRAWFRSADPASVGILGQIAVISENGDLPFRRAAAFALAAIHTQQALPYLATLMGDADPELRAESVRGLGSFANGLPVQTMAGVPSLAHLQPQANSPYRTDDTITHHPLNIQFIEQNESQYLPFWQTWWQTNHAALGY